MPAYEVQDWSNTPGSGLTHIFDEDAGDHIEAGILEADTIARAAVATAVHGSTAAFARPDAVSVLWIGTVEPDNMTANDLWLDQS